MSNYKIHIEALHRASRLQKRLLKRAAELVLTTEQIHHAEITIILVDDEYISKLNKDFLHHDATTDVISFSFHENSGDDFEGEVYANVDQIERQSREYEVTFADELFRIVIHGVLHLVGYDDQTRADKEKMTIKEDYYLALLTEPTNQGG